MANAQVIECYASDVDLKGRQKLLKEYAENPVGSSFELKEEKDEKGELLNVYIELNKNIVGRFSQDDLELYKNNFYNSSRYKMFILEEEVDGKTHYGVEVDISVPYIGTEAKKNKNIKTRVTSVIILSVLFIMVLIKAIIDKNMGTIIFSVIALVTIVIWIFLKSDTKFAEKFQPIKVRAKK